MDLQVSVFLLFVLFTAGQSLSCYHCTGLTDSCADQTEKACPSGVSHCESSTLVTHFGDFNSTVMAKDCSFLCATGSVNLGIVKMSSVCCNSDKCNVKDAPDPSSMTPNGKTCFSCIGNSCSDILSCLGTEDRCIKATGGSEGQGLVVKGCASKSICDATASFSSYTGISCCEGNLCNGAQSVTQSLMILCVPLLSFILML